MYILPFLYLCYSNLRPDMKQRILDIYIKLCLALLGAVLGLQEVANPHTGPLIQRRSMHPHNRHSVLQYPAVSLVEELCRLNSLPKARFSVQELHEVPWRWRLAESQYDFALSQISYRMAERAGDLVGLMVKRAGTAEAGYVGSGG